MKWNVLCKHKAEKVLEYILQIVSSSHLSPTVVEEFRAHALDRAEKGDLKAAKCDVLAVQLNSYLPAALARCLAKRRLLRTPRRK